MINWVKLVCEQWGKDQRRIQLGGRWVHNAAGRTWHFDGFPPRSMSDKIFREHFAAMAGAIAQHYPEVMAPESWHVQRIYSELNERRRIMMVGRYVARAHWKVIAETAGYLFKDGRIDKDHYYDDWDRIHTLIDCDPSERLAEKIRGRQGTAVLRSA